MDNHLGIRLTCDICKRTYKSILSTSKMLDCGHCSCKDCINHTLKLENKCPVCLYTMTIIKRKEKYSRAYNSATGRKGKALASTGARPRKGASYQTRMKKSSSVADLEVWQGEVRERRHSDGNRHPFNFIDENGRSERIIVDQNIIPEEGVKYSHILKTVQLHTVFNSRKWCNETVENGIPYNSENLKFYETVDSGFDVGNKLVTCATTDSDLDDEDKTVLCTPVDSDFNVMEHLGPRNPFRESADTSDSDLDNEEKTAPCNPVDSDLNIIENLGPRNPFSESADTNVAGPSKLLDTDRLQNHGRYKDYALDPGDLIHFEELNHSYDEEEESDISALESVFRPDTQQSRHSDQNNPIMERESSAGNDNQPLVVEGNASGCCQDHGHPYSFVCLMCNVWGCPSCSDDDHKKNASDSCFVVKAQEGVKVLKLSFKENARKCVRKAIRVKERVSKGSSAVNIILGHYEKKAFEIRQELDIVENNLSELRKILVMDEDAKRDASTVISTLKNSLLGIKGSSNCNDLIKAMDSLSTYNCMMDQYLCKNPKKVSIIPNIHLSKKEEIISLLHAGAPIYGIFGRNGSKLYAQLSLEGEGILVHCLREDVYPNEGVAILVLKFESLSAMIPDESPSIFLDIGWAGERRGRVYVNLFGNTPRSHQAILLCSGERGPSYMNTNFHKYLESSSRWPSSKRYAILYGGDYEYNDGSGGKAILEDIFDGEEYSHPAKEGLMVGLPASESWRTGSFGFYLVADTAKPINTAFGVVSQKLRILKAAAELDSVTHAYISDCGFVIPF